MSTVQKKDKKAPGVNPVLPVASFISWGSTVTDYIIHTFDKHFSVLRAVLPPEQ